MIYLFCRFCGKTVLDDSVFCSYCGKKLVEGIEENQSTNFDFSSLDGAISIDKEYQARLSKARAFAITEKYQQAMEIYTKMIDDDPTDTNGYIGCIRVASKNFTDINGYFYFKNENQATTCYYVSKSIETFKKLLGGAHINDKECEEFIKKYDEHMKTQEKARLEQEKAQRELEKQRQEERENQEKQRQAELERKQREEEEAIRRRPDDFKEALLVGNEAIRQKNLDTAYKAYAIALNLASELEIEMPDGFLENISKACENHEKEAMRDPKLLNYLRPIAAKGNITAQCLLGRINYLGGNQLEGLRWYKDLANKGVAEGLFYMGESIQNKINGLSSYSGNNDNTKKELYLQAYFWYKQAYDKGYTPAIERVAWYNRYGLGVAKNISFALELYKRINNYDEVAKIYHYEIKNMNDAIYWYKLADKSFEIAKIYEGQGRKNEAIEYYKKCIGGEGYYSDQAQKAVARLLYGTQN